MIPQRVYLRGFLSYRDEQEVRFDGSALWMLSGLNGSGKSSVFDAVTYALFGHHRGGHQQANELINKDSNAACVEFDFTQDGDLFRVRRTLQRDARGGARGTQQVLRWARDTGPHGGKWHPVEDTNRRTEFEAWVRDHVGLTYETFTSSVLLLQGRAEKLLDSTAKGRFEVLAGIVDLDRYRRLHEKADGRRKAAKAHVEALGNHRDTIPEVAEMELVAAENRIADCRDARDKARLEAERWQGLEYQAQRWVEVCSTLSGLKQRWNQAQALVAEAESLEKAMARLGELRSVLPPIESAFKQRRQATEAEGRLTGLTREKEDFDLKITNNGEHIEQARSRRLGLQKKIVEAEALAPKIEVELRELDRVLERAKQWDRQRADLVRLEEQLAQFPSDMATQLQECQKRWEELVLVERACPLLERLSSERERLRQALVAGTEQQKKEIEIKKSGEGLRNEHTVLTKKAEGALKIREEADREAAMAQALLLQLQENWSAFTALEGAQTCRQCGQPLTAAHLEMERRRRQQELDEAKARCSRTATSQRKARGEEQALKATLKEKTAELEEAREEFREIRAALAQSRKDADRAREECLQACQPLPEPYKGRVGSPIPGEGACAPFPTSVDLENLRRELGEVSVVRHRLQEMQKRHDQWGQLQAQVNANRKTLAALEAELPRDLPVLRQRHVTLEADRKTQADNLRALREADRASLTEVERLGREREGLQKQQADRQARITAEETTRRHALEAVAAALKGVPAPWRAAAEKAGLGDIHSWKQEQESLEANDTEVRFKELEAARHGLASLRHQISSTEAMVAAIPTDARRSVAEVRAHVLAARQEYDARDEAFRKAEADHAGLVTLRTQRETLQKQILEAESEYRTLQTLSQLLGRDRLQLHLVRQAERQIVDHANGVLDRLSGGQLFLRLRGSEDGEGSDHALELEAYNRNTGQQPINVAFLSGSQRFRVAVSLALGIGQYASRQHRPIESVIIDEGFGCLDRHGRQVMIQELQNLRGHLHCILLVSHQEEFADAFNDGYVFELEKGATRVKRIRR